ncbi:MAG: phosphate/phosphite/phosphonate ABC transporter substrate-binding protein, partial [Deltaproteobacteria bacterium]|nr:phosphate/phosphite/phosphonate ABC transporter substrate-binding protein [Deltaproteobacteria bacterium]
MKLLQTLSLAVVLTFVFAGISAAEIKIGVLALRGPEKAVQQWGSTGEYLSAKLGEKVSVVPLKFEAVDPMIKDGQVDFFLVNSAMFVEMEKKYQARAVATLINSVDGKPMDRFGGVIFVKNDSPIQKMEDIRGKKFMVVDFASFGGGQMAWRTLLEAGIDPQKDLGAFLEGKKHDNVVLAVLNGSADAGSVRTDIMERMQN